MIFLSADILNSDNSPALFIDQLKYKAELERATRRTVTKYHSKNTFLIDGYIRKVILQKATKGITA